MKKYQPYFLLRIIIISFLFVIVFIFNSSCSKKNYSAAPEYRFTSIDKKPDYSNLNYWAAHPCKKHPSDSVPMPLLKSYLRVSSVDVFFIYPTTLTSKKDTIWNADIDDSKINSKTDYSSILYQASVFNESCRVFSPRYRQANIKVFYISDSASKKYFDLAYEDIKNAFEYYLAHFNNGRPIIIASHSQGTKHASRLLKEFFDGKILNKQLVCAYIIGLPIADNYFNTLIPCKDSTSTGCFVSWRTYKRGYIEPIFVAKETFKAVVINPLSWSADSAFISSGKNKGGILLNYNKIIPHAVNAEIYHNVLWTCKPNFLGKIFITN
ncbi:MAG: DUF3089 domain-containing protein, partial [Ferruginibacter sp.]